ncbi:MAG: FG-GAP repeat protein [Acidobacteria bacterium]|nr:FG-GAP repeat protein [Acidobacteriota bacterium]
MIGTRGVLCPLRSGAGRLLVAALISLSIGSTAQAAAKLAFVGAVIDDSAGNNDGLLQPGELVTLRLKLFNDGDVAATGVGATLVYTGTPSDVIVVTPSGSWPNLPARGAPALSTAPHFQIQLSGGAPCGAVLPFRLDVNASSGGPVSLTFALKAEGSISHDARRDALRRADAPESTFTGAAAFDDLGSAVATADVDGDGFADIILGAPLSDSLGGTRTDAGAVYLVYGRRAQWSDTDLAAPPTDVVRIWGARAGDGLGAAVASGDLNGDGYDDLILGAPSSDSVADSRPGAGTVYVIYGGATRLADIDLAAPPAGVARFFGADPVDALGSALGAADINLDGRDDLIIGAPYGDGLDNLRADAGEAFIVYGQAAHFGDVDLASPPSGTVRVAGADAGDLLGSAVATGDFGGGGRPDVALGAPSAASAGNARSRAGEVAVIYGDSAPSGDIDLATPPSGVIRFFGPVAGGALGTALAMGDLNGDGLADLVMGAPGSPSRGGARPGAGDVWLAYGQSALWTSTDLDAAPAGTARIEATSPFQSLGGAVAAGDVNGDGYDDLVLAAAASSSRGAGRPGAGEVDVLYGSAQPFTDIDLSSQPSSLARFWGGEKGDAFGSSVALGDVDGDGIRDVVAGAKSSGLPASGRNDSGSVALWYGKSNDTYVARGDAFAFIDASVGSLLPLACDDCSIPIPIGFTFPFYGERFSTLYVGSNGLVSFAPIDNLASAVPLCMPAVSANRLLIAPYWDDLNPGAGAPGSGVFAMMQGTAPNRRLTIEWKDVPHKPAVGAATFEATLFEASGQILFQYQDADFGSAGFDHGASAVTGVMNRTGAHGVAASCFSAGSVPDVSAARLVPSTPIVENRAEHGAGLWSGSGLWHLSTSACEPNQRTGSTGWYYGIDSTCTYADPNFPTNAGSLNLPEVAAVPADARLSFWYRRATDGQSGRDLSTLQVSTAGAAGPYADVAPVTDSSGAWRYSGITSLAPYAGATADLRFRFDTVDASDNAHLGFMIDDVQVTGCGAATGGAGTARAAAYASPTVLCAGTGGSVDATGSYCAGGDSPASFQWKENGGDIPGATASSYAIPSSQPLGTYGYSVAVTCAGGASDVSPAASVSVVSGAPGAVGATLAAEHVNSFTGIRLTWSDIPLAADYVVFESATKNGAFGTVSGTSTSGATGLTLGVPPGVITYYLVAGRGGCGTGPKH